MLAPCERAADAACWSAAARIASVHTPRGLLPRRLDVDLRLAHRDGGLLLRVGDLPGGATVEVVEPNPTDGRASRHLGSWVLDEGVHALQLRQPLVVGRPRTLAVQVLLNGPEGTLPLLPGEGTTGRADALRVLPVAERPIASHTVQVDLSEEHLRIDAPGAHHVQLVHLDADVLQGREAALHPQSRHEGPPPLELPVPGERGTWLVEASWGEGEATDLIRRTVELEGRAHPAVREGPLHPAPRHLELRGGELDVSELDRICILDARWQGPAELLAEEVERLTARVLPVERCTAGRRRVSLGPVSGRRGQRGLLAGKSDAFLLELSPRAARVEATSVAGATYGALALADALGVDGRSPTMAAVDWPALEHRTLVHRLDGWHGKPYLDDELRRFHRRVVARGRYSHVVLVLRGAYAYESHPELAAGAWALDRPRLQALVDDLLALGIVPIPGINTPGHADWLLAAHPELMEDQKGVLLCTRHPGSRALVQDVMDELIEVFRQPPAFHLGHDEVRWNTHLTTHAQRCARCARSERAHLYAAWLRWQIAALRERDITPMIWSDMLIADWNGGAEGLTRATDWIPAEERASLVVMPWTAVGEGTEPMVLAGYRVQLVSTGALDVRRLPLARNADVVEGAGLALFNPMPWQLLGWSPLPAALWSSSANVVMHGATAWRPELATEDLEASLAAVADHPAYLPGFRALPPGSDRHALHSEGEPIEVGGVGFQVGTPAVVAAGAPLSIPLGEEATAISILQHAIVEHATLNRLHRGAKRASTRRGSPAYELVVEYADGEEERVPAVLGRDLWIPELEPAAQALWGTSGTWRDATGEAWYRWDWRGSRPVRRARIEVAEPGLLLQVAGITVR